MGTVKAYAGVAELADAPDLGSGIYDVQVQVLSPALHNIWEKSPGVYPGDFLLYKQQKIKQLLKI